MKDKDTKTPQRYSVFLKKRFSTTSSRQKKFVNFHNKDQVYETQSRVSDDHILKPYSKTS